MYTPHYLYALSAQRHDSCATQEYTYTHPITCMHYLYSDMIEMQHKNINVHTPFSVCIICASTWMMSNTWWLCNTRIYIYTPHFLYALSAQRHDSCRSHEHTYTHPIIYMHCFVQWHDWCPTQEHKYTHPIICMHYLRINMNDVQHKNIHIHTPLFVCIVCKATWLMCNTRTYIYTPHCLYALSAQRHDWYRSHENIYTHHI